MAQLGDDLALRVDLADDPTLRAVVKAARAWGVSPSKFMGARTITTYEYRPDGKIARAIQSPEWTDQDREFAYALEDYEAGYCPGGPHPLAEMSKAEYEEAWVPDTENEARCHLCAAKALVTKLLEQRERSAGVSIPLKLDLDIVERNKQPVPPLPPELQPELQTT